jgi:hypothetical protein
MCHVPGSAGTKVERAQPKPRPESPNLNTQETAATRPNAPPQRHGEYMAIADGVSN